jgi:hypothetical protein
VSLINEALRKARQAAAEHDDQRSAGRPPQAYPSRGPRSGTGPAAVALVAVLAGLAGAAGVWWIVGTASNEPQSAEAEVHLTTPVVDSASPPTEPASNTQPPLSTVEPKEKPDRAATPTKVVTTSGARVFVMDADLGYASLSLGYIVFRPVRPFAEINGAEVYEGSEVAGFTVEKIEVDRIVLRDSRGPLELRVP